MISLGLVTKPCPKARGEGHLSDVARDAHSSLILKHDPHETFVHAAPPCRRRATPRYDPLRRGMAHFAETPPRAGTPRIVAHILKGDWDRRSRETCLSKRTVVQCADSNPTQGHHGLDRHVLLCRSARTTGHRPRHGRLWPPRGRRLPAHHPPGLPVVSSVAGPHANSTLLVAHTQDRSGAGARPRQSGLHHIRRPRHQAHLQLGPLVADNARDQDRPPAEPGPIRVAGHGRRDRVVGVDDGGGLSRRQVHQPGRHHARGRAGPDGRVFFPRGLRPELHDHARRHVPGRYRSGSISPAGHR